MLDAAKQRTGVSLPPWLWVWLVVYAVSLPEVMNTARFQLRKLTGIEVDFGGETLFFTRFSYLPTFLVALTVLAGILTVFLPAMRRAYLERRFRLTASPSISPALKEIDSFIHVHAPNIELKGNLLRTDQLAFVYPLGYRTTAMALFGGLVKLWRSDREAAEAVVLHEIAHYRNGDTLLVGAGSLFTSLIRYLPLITFVSLVIAIPARSISWMATQALSYEWNLVTPALLLQIVALWIYVMFYLVVALILPVIGIWCAEFNADRFAVKAQESPNALIRVLQSQRNTSRWRWLVFRFTHPPDRARQWLAKESEGIVRSSVLLLLFPLACVFQIVLEEIYYFAGLGFDVLFGKWDVLEGKVLVAWLVTNLKTGAWQWLAMAILVLLWPVLERYWQWPFRRELRQQKIFEWVVFREHHIVAAILTVTGGLYLSTVLYYAPIAKYDMPEPGWMSAGKYELDLFRPPLSFSVDQGWYAMPEDEVYDVFQIGRTDGTITFQNVHVVFRPDLIGENPYQRVNLYPAPDDMVEWFQEHPYLDTTPTSPISVGGAPGVAFGASISASYAPRFEPTYCPRGYCLPLFFHSEGRGIGSFAFLDEDRITYSVIVVDVEGETVVIIISAPVDDFSGFLREAVQVLSTVKWRGMAAPDPRLSPKSALFDFTESKVLRVPMQGPLPPGQYLTDEFEPTLSFSIKEGWRIPYPEQERYLHLKHRDLELTFANVKRVYDPSNIDIYNPSAPPKDIGRWLQNHPYLDAERPVPVMVGGRPGKLMDVAISATPQNYPSACPGPCVPLFHFEETGFYLRDGYHNRLILLQVKGKTVVVIIESPAKDFEEFAPKAETLLGTVRWKD
jgi:Zn-dependent protease with chaperone function